VRSVKAKFKVMEKRGSTLVLGVVLEDGRGFVLTMGQDRIGDLARLVKEHAMSLFGVEVDKVEESK
jgi:hypothetical protein